MQSPKPTFSIRRPSERTDELERFVAAGDEPVKEVVAELPKQESRRRVTLTRRDGRVVRRMNLCLPEETARALAVFCAERDFDMSSFVTEAVARALSDATGISER